MDFGSILYLSPCFLGCWEMLKIGCRLRIELRSFSYFSSCRGIETLCSHGGSRVMLPQLTGQWLPFLYQAAQSALEFAVSWIACYQLLSTGNVLEGLFLPNEVNANCDLQFYLFRFDSVQQNMCLAACLQHRPLASMDIHGIPWHSMTFHDIPWHSMTFHDIPWHSMTFHDIPWHSMTFHDPQVNVEGLRLLQSYSRGVCNCLWSSAATNLTSPGFWSMVNLLQFQLHVES